MLVQKLRSVSPSWIECRGTSIWAEGAEIGVSINHVRAIVLVRAAIEFRNIDTESEGALYNLKH